MHGVPQKLDLRLGHEPVQRVRRYRTGQQLHEVRSGERYTPHGENCGTYEMKENQRYANKEQTIVTKEACKADCDNDEGCHGYSWKANTPLYKEKFKGRCAGTGDGLNEHLAIPLRYVRIRASDTMNFSQVTVRDKAGNNLSKNKPCASNGHRGNAKCQNSLDGHQGMRTWSKGYHSTGKPAEAYWQVDLGANAAKMATVTIHNRSDDEKHRLGNATMELLDGNKNIIGTKRLTKANEQTHHLFDFDIKTIPKELSHDDNQIPVIRSAKGGRRQGVHNVPGPREGFHHTDCSKITDRDECLASKDTSESIRFASLESFARTPGGYSFSNKGQAEKSSKQDGFDCVPRRRSRSKQCATWTREGSCSTRPGLRIEGWNSKGGKAPRTAAHPAHLFQRQSVRVQGFPDSKTKVAQSHRRRPPT